MPETTTHPTPPAGDYLGFDFGLKRIGIATGSSVTVTAMPAKTVSNHCGTPHWATIDQLVKEWQPKALVCGNPLHMDETQQEIAQHAGGFARMLKRRYNLPVFLADERLSSVAAEATLREIRRAGLKKKTDKQDIDKIAAAILLEQWLEAHFGP